MDPRHYLFSKSILKNSMNCGALHTPPPGRKVKQIKAELFLNNTAGASSGTANSSPSAGKVIHLLIRLPARYFSIKPPTTNLPPCHGEALIKLPPPAAHQVYLFSFIKPSH